VALLMGELAEPGERWHEDLATMEGTDGRALVGRICFRDGRWWLIVVVGCTGERLLGLKIPHAEYGNIRSGTFRSRLMGFLKKVEQVRKAVEVQASLSDSSWSKEHPALAEYLLSDEYPDGEVRQTSTILLFCEAGEVRACLNDRDQGRSLWATGTSVEAAFLALELRCQDEKAEWRVTNVQAKSQPSKKKRR